MHGAINEIDAQKCTEKIVYVQDTAVRHLPRTSNSERKQEFKSSSFLLACLFFKLNRIDAILKFKVMVNESARALTYPIIVR